MQLRAPGLGFPAAQAAPHPDRASRGRAGDDPVGQRDRHRRRRGQLGPDRRGNRRPIHAPDGQHPRCAHPPTACTDPKPRPLARMASRTRLIRPHPGYRPAAAAACHLVAADPGLQPGRRALPVAAGDQQRATLLPRAGHHRPRPGRRHRAPAKAEHDQIHAVHQHRCHLNRICPRIGNDGEPAQIRPHLDGREQTDVGLADDGRMPTRCRHRRHHAQRQRPGTRQHRHRPLRQCGRDSLSLRVPPLAGKFGQRQQTFRLGKHVVRRHADRADAGTDLAGYRRHLAAQVFYLFSTVNPMPIQAHRRRHSSTFRLIRIIAHSKVCSIRRVNTRPPTPSSVSSAVRDAVACKPAAVIPEESFAISDKVSTDEPHCLRFYSPVGGQIGKSMTHDVTSFGSSHSGHRRSRGNHRLGRALRRVREGRGKGTRDLDHNHDHHDHADVTACRADREGTALDPTGPNPFSPSVIAPPAPTAPPGDN